MAKKSITPKKNAKKPAKKSVKGKPQPKVKQNEKKPVKAAKKKTEEPTIEKPPIKYGKGAMNGSTGKKFSKDYQPSKEAKMAGIIRRKTLKELLSMPLKSKLPKTEEEFICHVMATYNIKREEVDVRLFMEMKLAERVYKHGDAIAYKALLDRAFGKPMTEHPPVVETPQGEKSIISMGNGIEIEI